MPSTVDPPYRPVIGRRRFLLTSLAGALAAPLSGDAQETRGVHHIGVLSATTPEWLAPLLEVFQAELNRRGFPPDRIVIHVRHAGGRYELLRQLADELVRLPVDIIVTAQSTPATRAAKDATSTIPIVMVAVGDPLQTGLVSNLARPGGNLTGSSALAVELTPKRLELIRQLLPTAKRVALLWNPENPSNAQLRNELVRAAATAGVTLLSVGARRASEFDTAFTTLTRERPDALIVTADPLHQVHIGRVIGFAARSRLPAVYNLKANVEAGSHIIRREPCRSISACGHLRSKNLEWRQAGRSSRRATDHVRARHQCQDCEGPRPDDPAIAAGTGGSGDRVVDRRRAESRAR